MFFTFYFLLFTFIFGLIIGSFINCLVYRLHKKKSMWGRSFCPKCRHGIAWYDNIPVLSFLCLLGKCRRCKKKISWEYPVVEFVTGTLFVVVFIVNFQFSPEQLGIQTIYNFSIIDLSKLFRDFFIVSVMIIIFLYDLKYYLILDIVTLPSALLIFIANVYLGMDWKNLLFSGIIGGSFFLIQFLISQGKWVGGGDIRLGFLMGIILGFPNILAALFIAYILGSLVGIYLILAKKKQWSSKVPMGIFLTSATIITLFWGEELIDWYFGILF